MILEGINNDGGIGGGGGGVEEALRPPRFERSWFWVAASVLAWVAFWDLADRHQAHMLSRIISWAAVLAAIWVANNL